eukprot:TRINITY_DN1632_c0_g1_i1.p1 TRINITY_DN1632_c0_g1~~TRINITY_DN1632_c0_g1_i1.p1  ORF type:complete len:571 (+),score=233.55 TRINITY_DN1632_c0_g1_i1:61-1773(+)
MTQPLLALAAKASAERDNFVAFFSKHVDDLSVAAAAAAERRSDDAAATAAAAMLKTRNVLLKSLSEIRCRLLRAFEEADAAAGLGLSSQGARKDALVVVSKELRSLRQRWQCAVKPVPVVAVLGLHGDERQHCAQTVLRLGGAFCDRIVQQTVTHVVLPDDLDSVTPERAETLKKVEEWDVKVVRARWLADSGKAGAFCDTAPYENYASAPPMKQEAVKEEPADDVAATPQRAIGRAYEELAAAVQQRGPGSSSSRHTQSLSVKGVGGDAGPVHPRVSRRDFVGDAGPPAKRARVSGRGSANTRSPEDLAPEGVEALQAPPPRPVHDLDKLAGATVSGQDSQLVRWDSEATARAADLKKVAALRIFQMAGTAQCKPERDKVVAAIRKLGGEVELVPRHVTRATHLCSLTDQYERTEKYLCFVASGKWIVSKQYVYESEAAGSWLDESDYTPPNPRITALRQMGGSVFRGWRCVLLLHERITPGVAAILHAGGCADVSSGPGSDRLATATHIFSDVQAPAGERAEVTIPAAHCDKVQEQVFSIDFLHKYLCCEIREQDLRHRSRLRVRAAP